MGINSAFKGLMNVIPVKKGSVTFYTKLRKQKITSKAAAFYGSQT
jgi:hypothetical protein